VDRRHKGGPDHLRAGSPPAAASIPRRRSVRNPEGVARSPLALPAHCPCKMSPNWAITGAIKARTLHRACPSGLG